MSLKKEIEETLEKNNLKPKKYFGQNFLIEKGILNQVIEAAELKKEDFILEVGSGLGTLTKELAKRAKKVIAFEKDKELARILNQEFDTENIKNVKIIPEDVLKSKIENFETKYKVVANLPYYITSPVIRKFLEMENPPFLMVFMVQKEVAKRICQKPPNMSLLSVAVQVYATPKIVKIVKKDSFWPKPKVDSAILKISPLIKAKNEIMNANQFFKIVKAGFSSPRKQLKNNFQKVLSKKEMFHVKHCLDLSRRAQSLSIDEWKKIGNIASQI